MLNIPHTRGGSECTRGSERLLGGGCQPQPVVTERLRSEAKTDHVVTDDHIGNDDILWYVLSHPAWDVKHTNLRAEWTPRRFWHLDAAILKAKASLSM